MNKLYYIHYEDGHSSAMWVNKTETFADRLNNSACKKSQKNITSIEQRVSIEDETFDRLFRNFKLQKN